MDNYEQTRQRYLPKHIALLLIAESPPPRAEVQSSRHFYRSEQIRVNDRLFTNTIWALYPEASALSEKELETRKEEWLHRLQADGIYMIEALEASQQHSVTKHERQERIQAALPTLLARLRAIAKAGTPIILIKSNVFEVAAKPLRQAGFTILNTELVDYPGQFNQRAYRQKLAALVEIAQRQSKPQ